MSVPADMMQRIASSRQGGAMPGGGEPGPAAAPMATPQKKDGRIERSKLQVHMGMDLLEQAMGELGSESPEGQVVLKCLQNLGKTFGERNTANLVPAEMRELANAMPQRGGDPRAMQIGNMQAANGPARMPQPPAPMPAPQ